MKRNHTKYFVIFYAIALAMMGTPLVRIANKSMLVLGMPMLLTWVVAWTLIVTLVLVLNYRMDVKVDEENRKHPKPQQAEQCSTAAGKE